MVLALVEEAEQHVERLARSSRDVVQHRHLCREQRAGTHVGSNHLAAGLLALLAADHGVADELRVSRCSWAKKLRRPVACMAASASAVLPMPGGPST